MYRFWNTIIEPAFQILQPKTIVEIGVDEGRQTSLILAYCREKSALLHAVDPKPSVDMEDWVAEHPAHLLFHRDISLNVLGAIDADAVLIDGDHNWYTVFHELQLLEKQATRTGRFPAVFLHDTGWPYARRDLYYAPERIPDAYRKSYAQKGMLPDQAALSEHGGLNPSHKHAVEENQLQNGVLTAVESFLEQSSLDLRFVHVPGLHGLGIITPLSLLEEHPGWSAFMNSLQTGGALRTHMDAMEADRLRVIIDALHTEESKQLMKEQARFQRQQYEKEAERHAVSQTRIRALTAEIQHIKQSRSWRWTQPVRRLEMALRRALRVFSTKNSSLSFSSLRTSVQQLNRKMIFRMPDMTHAGVWLENAGYALLRSGKKVWVALGSPFPRTVRSIRVHILGRLWRVLPAGQEATAIIRTEALHQVTIIIPIYNAYEDTVRCLESVLKETTAPLHRILLVNDASTDPRMEPFLEALAARAPERVERLTHAENQGFIRSVNAGMRHASGDDIVLLNSDTIVTPFWLERLRETVYLHADTGSVTPLSNEASIYSVCQNNIDDVVKADMLNTLADTVFRVSHRLRPAIPTGVGFCLFLRHEALEKTGLFDERFGRGYAEENDWCMRARALGFRHYLDDTCFIYHKGHVSMEAAGVMQGSDVIEKNEALLRTLHPQYEILVAGFLSTPVMPSIRMHVEQHSALKPVHRRLRIGFLLHQPIRQHSIGGTEFHVSDLVGEIRADADCFVLYPDRHDIVVMHESVDGTKPQYFRYRKNGKSETDLQETFSRIFADYAFDILHVHHTLGLSFELLPLAKAHNIRVIYTVHDWLCMNDVPATLCQRNEDMADQTVIERRRAALAAADRIVAPSHFVQKFVSKFFGFPEGSIEIIEHGISSKSSAPFVPGQEPLVCFLGATHIPYKGKPLIAALIPLLEERGIRSAFLGSDAYEWPELRKRKSVTFYGFFKREDVQQQLHTIAPHLICLLPLWPETFSYTLSEAWSAGIPVYVTPFGAPEERVLRHGGGKVAPSLDPVVIADDIASFLTSPDYQQTIALTRGIRLPDMTEMGRRHLALYQTVTGTGTPSHIRSSDTTRP